MDVGPDGSLCRLTSSYDKYVSNVKIVQVFTEEGVDFKLVAIGEKKDECESASEKSDDEISITLESLDIELGISKPEKAKDDKTEEVIVQYNKNSRNKPFNRRSRPNNMNRHRKNYISPGHRNFKSYNNGNKSYNRQTMNTDNIDINVWLEPPQILNSLQNPLQNPLQNYSFTNYPQNSYVVLNPNLNTSITSNIDPPTSKGRGLLGNSPFDPYPPNYQPGNANLYSHNQNYWKGECTNDDYQHPVQNVQMRGKPPFKNHHNGKFWKNGPKNYNRNPNRKRRGGRNGRFYRQQQ